MSYAFDHYADTNLTDASVPLDEAQELRVREILDHVRGKDLLRKETLVDLELLINAAATSVQLQELVLKFCLSDVQEMLDRLQEWLDLRREEHPLFRKGIYLLVKISRASETLPTQLWLHDVTEVIDFPPMSGGFSYVWQGSYRGQLVAVKMPLGGHLSETLEFCKVAAKEALVWRQLRHDRVLRLLGLHSVIKQEGQIGMVSPFMAKGDISDFIKERHTLPEPERNRLLQDVAEGLSYLHSLKIVHGDLKDKNVFVDEHGRAVLADFGLILVGQNTVGGLYTQKDDMSAPWVAPERLNAGTLSQRPEAPGDVYSFGHLCVMLCTGDPPAKGMRHEQIIILTNQGVRPDRPSPERCTVSHMSDDLWNIVSLCFIEDPLGRPTISAVSSDLQRIE